MNVRLEVRPTRAPPSVPIRSPGSSRTSHRPAAVNPNRYSRLPDYFVVRVHDSIHCVRMLKFDLHQDS